MPILYYYVLMVFWVEWHLEYIFYVPTLILFSLLGIFKV